MIAEPTPSGIRLSLGPLAGLVSEEGIWFVGRLQGAELFRSTDLEEALSALTREIERRVAGIERRRR